MISLDSYLEDNSVDLVDSILTDPDGNAYDYSAKAGKAIWATYRYAMLNCRDSEKYITRWIQRGRDIAYNMDERYSQLFSAYEAFKADGSMVSIDITETTSTTATATNSGASSNENEQTSENIPQYADASQGTWLTGRGKSNGSGTTSDNSSSEGTMTRKGTGGAIATELIERMRNGLFNPYLEYASEFRDLFIPFYIDECYCGCSA